MHMKIHLPVRGVAIACGVLACALGTACGDNELETPPPAFPAELASALQASLEQSVADRLAPGFALFVSHPDGGTWAGAAGIADISQGNAMMPDAHFRAGSMLKPLVATAILQRVEAGQLALDATLTDLLPEAITARIASASMIDVRMLLGHRSGIPDCVTDELKAIAVTESGRVFTLDEFLTAVATQEPTGAPGAAYSYSNTNYVLLGEILRAQTGRDWRDVVTEDVIDRAGMSQSSLPLPGDRDVPAPLARGYVPLGDSLLDVTHMDPSMAAASGGHALVTTPADLTTFMQALRAGELFDDPATLEQMFTFLPALEPQAYQTQYGLGLSVTEVEGVRYVGHLGSTAGYFGFTFHMPVTGYYFSGYMTVQGDLGAFLLPILALLSEQ
jgi:D-alanyl-D-alanine carboxypeptidase